MTNIEFDGTFAGWRRAARVALARRMAPSQLQWNGTDSTQSLLGIAEPAGKPSAVSAAFRVPGSFLTLAESVACHREAGRWALLYRVLWRLTQGESQLLENTIDPDVQDLHAMARAVHRESHRMRAFVRFREIAGIDGSWFVAWYEPQHHVVEANAGFFRDRFANMRWSILTPERCAHWDMKELTFTEGVTPAAAPTADAMEDLWRTYYASVFNPARVNASALATHLPRRFWKNLPEASVIPDLVASARPRADSMVVRNAVEVVHESRFGRADVPDTRQLGDLRAAAVQCRACPLWRKATCTVFGEGPGRASIVFVGEQPGDQEDRGGRPFIGPAGRLLDRALAAAGIDRSTVYLTNAVKHFKWQPRGKRRLHQRPNAREIAACRPWLEAELRLIRPRLIVCLGGTAAQSVIGRAVAIMSERGTKLDTEFGAPALVTVHPSSLLRLPPEADPTAEFERFVADLRRVDN